MSSQGERRFYLGGVVDDLFLSTNEWVYDPPNDFFGEAVRTTIIICSRDIVETSGNRFHVRVRCFRRLLCVCTTYDRTYADAASIVLMMTDSVAVRPVSRTCPAYCIPNQLLATPRLFPALHEACRLTCSMFITVMFCTLWRCAVPSQWGRPSEVPELRGLVQLAVWGVNQDGACFQRPRNSRRGKSDGSK